MFGRIMTVGLALVGAVACASRSASRSSGGVEPERSEDLNKMSCGDDGRIRRIRTVAIPAPEVLSDENVTAYCFRQLMDGYGLSRRSSSVILRSFFEVIHNQNLGQKQELKYYAALCGHLPDALPFSCNNAVDESATMLVGPETK